MELIKWGLVICLLVGGGLQWNKHQNHKAAVEGAQISASGFVLLPPMTEPHGNAVMVYAAENCPHEDAQRADRLAEDLRQAGIPVKRGSSANFQFDGQAETGVVERINNVMQGSLPVVFVGDRAKANPSLAEVTAEYRRSQPRS